jgi:hypothetical protein
MEPSSCTAEDFVLQAAALARVVIPNRAKQMVRVELPAEAPQPASRESASNVNLRQFVLCWQFRVEGERGGGGG